MPRLMSPTTLTALGLCLDIHGNFGGVCFRRQARLGTIAYFENKHPGALSPRQARHRAQWNTFYEGWHALTDAQRADWRRVADHFSTRQVNAHLCMMTWWRNDQHFIALAKRHTNIDLVMPPPYPNPWPPP